MKDLDARALFECVEYLKQVSAIERYIIDIKLNKDEKEELSDRLYESGVRIYE